MVQSIPENSPRWIIFDLDFEDKGQGKSIQMNKIVFIVYNPDNSQERAQKVSIMFKKDYFIKRITSKVISYQITQFIARNKSEIKKENIIIKK